MVTFANAIDSIIGASISGATNTLTVQNPSNTANSSALINTTIGGTSAGFVMSRFVIGTADSFAWVLNASTPTSFQMIYAATGTVTPGTSTNTPIRGEVGGGNGSVTIRSGLNVVSEGERSGSNVNIFLANTNATAGSTATMNIQTVAGGGFMAFALNGAGYNWIWGNNQPVNQNWQLRSGANADFTTSTLDIDVTQAGAISFPQVPGTTVANQVAVTMNSATGQIGTAPFPGGGGGLVQTVHTTNTAFMQVTGTYIQTSNAVPTTSNTQTVMSLTITPHSSTNLLYFFVNICYGTGGKGVLALFQSPTTTTIGCNAMAPTGTGTAVGSSAFNFVKTAGTTSATTYTVNIGNDASSNAFWLNGFSNGTQPFGGGTSSCQFWIFEISV
jgi:hypothetical protein